MRDLVGNTRFLVLLEMTNRMLAIVLDRRDFREFDQIITLLTAEHGKIEALARGLKKMTAKNASALEPGSLVEAEIVPGKEIAHLIKSQAYTIFPRIRTDLAKISYAATVLRIVCVLVGAQERDERVFTTLKNFLFFLEDVGAVTSWTVAAFVLQLLTPLGFTPILDRCIVCGHVAEKQDRYIFDVSNGGILCHNCATQRVQQERILIKNISASELDIVRMLLVGSWSEIQALLVDSVSSQTVETCVYEFAVYHSNQKIPDWRQIAKLYT